MIDTDPTKGEMLKPDTDHDTSMIDDNPMPGKMAYPYLDKIKACLIPSMDICLILALIMILT